MRKIIYTLVGLLVAATTFADPDKGKQDSIPQNRKLGYFFYVGMGGSLGCSECSQTHETLNFTSSMVHGVRLGKRLAVGGGIGFDEYEHWKTVPFFGSVAYDLFGRTNRVFVQLNYGYAAAWINNSEKTYNYRGSSGGKYINPVLGYRLTQSKMRIYFTAGFKLTSTTTHFQDYLINPFYGGPTNSSESQTNLKRFVFAVYLGI